MPGRIETEIYGGFLSDRERRENDEKERQKFIKREQREKDKVASRRRFLKNVGEAAIGAAAAGIALHQASKGLESLADERGKENPEYFKERILEVLNASAEIVEAINPKALAENDEDAGRTHIVDVPKHKQELAETWQKNKDTALRQIKNARLVLQNIQEDVASAKALPALAKALESVSPQSPQLTRDSEKCYAAIQAVEFGDFLLSNVAYTQKIKSEFNLPVVCKPTYLAICDIKALYGELKKVPKFMVSNAQVDQLAIESPLLDSVLGSWNPLTKKVGITPGLENTRASKTGSLLLHEFVHAWDIPQVYIGLLFEQPPWANKSKKALTFSLRSGPIAVLTNKLQSLVPVSSVREKLSSKKSPEKIEESVNSYGAEAGGMEDRAVIGEMLFNPKSIKELFNKVHGNTKLREKVELMTGYHFNSQPRWEWGEELTPAEMVERKTRVMLENEEYQDWKQAGFAEVKKYPELLEYMDDPAKQAAMELATGHKLIPYMTLGTPVSDEEYIQKGLAGRDYFSKWSSHKGKVYLDAEFYNRIFNGEELYWEEDYEGEPMLKKKTY